MRTADGYIRVSKVGKRGGESFISPSEQRAAIEAWTRSTGTEILEWHEDLDESGGTLDRPAFTFALERCRAGLTGGIGIVTHRLAGSRLRRGRAPLFAAVPREVTQRRRARHVRSASQVAERSELTWLL
jgi:DNA invertase Pin-like site-specific DNA recombinase